MQTCKVAPKQMLRDYRQASFRIRRNDITKATIDELHPASYRRTLCLSPIMLPVVSIISALTENNHPLFSHNLFSVIFIVAALPFAILNFYLHPWWFIYRHGSRATTKPNISGFPLVSSICVVYATFNGFGSIGTALLGLAVIAIDTGGSPWFLVATWRDSSLWGNSK